MEAGLDTAPGKDKSRALITVDGVPVGEAIEVPETPEQRIARSVARIGSAMGLAAESLMPMIRRAGEAFQEAGNAVGQFSATINLEGLKVPEPTEDDPGARKGVPRSRTRKYAPCGGQRKAAQRQARRRNRKG